MEYTTLEQTLLTKLALDDSSEQRRSSVSKLVKHNIYRAFRNTQIRILEYGSFPLKTYLPEADIDLTVIIPHISDNFSSLQAIQRIHRQLDYAALHRPDLHIENITPIQAEVNVLKFQIKGLPIDVSINQLGGFKTLCFLQQADSILPNHFLKRSIIVVKCWAAYCSRILGSMHGLLSTYALEILVLFVMNCVPESRTSPIELLKQLVLYFQNFDWENSVVTCCGVLSASRYTLLLREGNDLEEFASMKYRDLILSPEFIKNQRKELKVESSNNYIQLKYINLADPLAPTNNLGRSVSLSSYGRIKLVFDLSAATICEKGVEAILSSIFSPNLTHQPSWAEEALGIPVRRPELSEEARKEFRLEMLGVNLSWLKKSLDEAQGILIPSFSPIPQAVLHNNNGREKARSYQKSQVRRYRAVGGCKMNDGVNGCK